MKRFLVTIVSAAMLLSVGAQAEPDESIPLDFIHFGEGPTFPGGTAAMYEWLSENMVYPEEAIKDGVSGKVVVSFNLDSLGALHNIEIVKKVHPALDAEVVRVFSSMPNWVMPSRLFLYDLIMQTTYMFPIRFTQSNIQTPVKLESN